MNTLIKKSDFIQSLEKGLNVISVFNSSNQQLTLTQVAKAVDLTRANARRVLLTLEHLHYVSSIDGKLFRLTPKVLCLGYSYLSSIPFREFAIPFMEALAAKVNESCSMAVLDEGEIVYVARVQTKRIMSISLAVGSRLPVHATSMGAVLMASMEPKEVDRAVRGYRFEVYTPHTIRNKRKYIERINEVRKKGWAISDQELEIGIRSIACPLKDKNGKTIAALNISGHTSRVTAKEMTTNYLPTLKETVSKIEEALHKL